MSDDFDSFSDDGEMDGDSIPEYSEIPRVSKEHDDDLPSDDSFFDDTQNSTNQQSINNALGLVFQKEDENVEDDDFYQRTENANNKYQEENNEENNDIQSETPNTSNTPTLPSLKKKLESLTMPNNYQSAILPSLNGYANSPKDSDRDDGFKFQTAQDTSIYEETQPHQSKPTSPKPQSTDIIYLNAPAKKTVKPIIQKPTNTLPKMRATSSQKKQLPPVAISAPPELRKLPEEQKSSLSSSNNENSGSNSDNSRTQKSKKREEEEVSIEEFDPSKPSKITEKISKNAMQNLGLSLQDISYPTDEELSKFEDEDLRTQVRSKLQHRVDSAIRDVIDERQRIIKRNQQMAIIMTRSAPPELSDGNSFLELERARMAKLQQVRNKSVEQVIFSLVMMNKNDEIQEQEEKRMAEYHRLRQKKIDEKRKQEEIKVSKIFEEKENIVVRKTIKNAAVVEATKQRLDNFEQKKIQQGIERKKKFEQEEIERQRHKNIAEDLERKEREEKERVYLERSLVEKIRQDKFREMRESELREARQKSALKNEEERKRVLAAQKKVDDQIEKKRVATELKMQKHDHEFTKLMEQRDAKIAELKEREINKQQKAKLNKTEIDKNLQQKKEEQLEMSNQKSIEALKERENERRKQRFSELTLNEIKHEDQKLIMERRERQRQVMLREQEEQYQMRLCALQTVQNQRERLRMKNQRLRIQLEMEKEKMLETTMGNNAGLKRTSNDKLRKLAESMGINYDMIEQRALKMTRSRAARSSDSLNKNQN